MMGLVWATCLPVILSHSMTRTQPGLNQTIGLTPFGTMSVSHLAQQLFCSAIQPKRCLSIREPKKISLYIYKLWLAIYGQSVASVWHKFGLLCNISAKGPCHQGQFKLVQKLTQKDGFLSNKMHLIYHSMPQMCKRLQSPFITEESTVNK